MQTRGVARGSGPVRQWGGLGKSREWTGGCEGLVCNCVDCSNRGTLPCPVDLCPRRLISQYAAEGCLLVFGFTWSSWSPGPIDRDLYVLFSHLSARPPRACRDAGTESLSNASEMEQKIDSRARERTRTMKQAQARFGFRSRSRSRSAQSLHASAPQVHVEAARRNPEVTVHTVPSAGGRAGEYTEPMTDGDGRGAWALSPSLPPSFSHP